MNFLAVDFGAGSGRAIVGSIEKDCLNLEEIHRFPNRQIKLGNSLVWDFPALFEELKTSIKLALQKYKKIESIAVDTWGVDFGLLDSKGSLIGMPVCYRDNRTNNIPELVFEKISPQKLYSLSGTQQMEINTIFQLYSMCLNDSPYLKIAESLLFMPDLFNYFLCGKKSNEYTIASTSGLLNCNSKKWDDDIFSGLQLPKHLMQNVNRPGEIIGQLSPEICKEINCNPINIVSVGSHDTASAVSIVNSTKKNRAFISSGTWSILGISCKNPITSDLAFSNNFTNEGGIWDDIRFQRNITGLWLLQSVCKEWGINDFSSLVNDAKKSNKFQAIFDVDNPIFANPQSMSNTITEYCNKTKQKQPGTKGEFVRTILESLAVKYGVILKKLENTVGYNVDEIQVIGGGSQNDLLCQLAADICKVPVLAGLVEATATGNIMTQAFAQNKISKNEFLNNIKFPFKSKVYHPENEFRWENINENIELW